MPTSREPPALPNALRKRKVVLGVVHLAPLPGSPFHEPGELPRILDTAVRSAVALREGGADGCLLQTADRVHSLANDADPARTAALTLITRAVLEATGSDFFTGVQMMRNGVNASLAIARVCNGAFVRVGGLVGVALTDYGILQPDPLAVMEYRAKIEAQDVIVIADVASMQFRWWGEPRPVAEIALAARRVGADAVAISDRDDERAREMIESIRLAAPDLPILLAGNTNQSNARALLTSANGVFVGRCLESAGWGSVVSVERVRSYVGVVRDIA